MNYINEYRNQYVQFNANISNKRRQELIDIAIKTRNKIIKRGFYEQTIEWKTRRKIRLDGANNACEICKNIDSLHLHHISYSNYGDEAYDDFIVLCQNCHVDYHNDKPLCQLYIKDSIDISNIEQSTYANKIIIRL
jgi:5-methylcytosine-specific restriction endonuclease McrA